ncbi:MAG: DMT family transporter [Marinicaulis sp.]|nr:DMT family transporter [Marinicaulis sp.]
MAVNFKSPKEATLYDWMLLAMIVAMGGSSFALIHNALESMPPAAIAVGRLWVGAIFLYIIMRHAGRRFPPLFQRIDGRLRLRRSWGSMIAVGASGYVLPFFLFPWAQQCVESGLAGIYMAFMPIWTLALAFFFAGEPVSRRKLVGFAMGFVGVIILMGPEVLNGAAQSDMRAQAGLLLATFLYAASTIYARRAAPIRPRVFAAGVVLSGTVIATPALLFIDLASSQWTTSAIFSVIGLGIGPTGLAAVLIIMLIRRTGAGFMSLANYVTPLWAVAVGALIFSERLEPNAFIALAAILAGVAVAQRAPKWQRSMKIAATTGEEPGASMSTGDSTHRKI